MKKLVKNIILIIITLTTFSFTTVFANSGPVYWQGYPSFDIMTVKKYSPIKVNSENLTFDFSDINQHSYSVSARVTAEYGMANPVNEIQSVQMAFTFVERLNRIDYDNIKITEDGKHKLMTGTVFV